MGEGRMGGGGWRFSFVPFRQSSGKLNYASTVNPRLVVVFCCLSPCPRLFLVEEMDYKNAEKSNCKALLIGDAACTSQWVSRNSD